MNKGLLVVGTMAYDAIETPYGKVDHILGGAATYIAFAASNFDIKIGIVSVIGDDFNSNDLKLLTNKKIDISELLKEKNLNEIQTNLLLLESLKNP